MHDSFVAMLDDLAATALGNAQIYRAAAAVGEDPALAQICRGHAQAHDAIAHALHRHMGAIDSSYRARVPGPGTAVLAAAALESLRDARRVARTIAAVEERALSAYQRAIVDRRGYDTIRRLLRVAGKRATDRHWQLQTFADPHAGRALL
jgi:hypothetical protein